MTNTSINSTTPVVGIASFMELHGTSAGMLDIADDAYDMLLKSYQEQLGLLDETIPGTWQKTLVVTREFPNLLPNECIDHRCTYMVRIVLIENPQAAGMARAEAIHNGYIYRSLRGVQRIVLDESPLQIGGRWWRDHLDLIKKIRRRALARLAVAAFDDPRRKSLTRAEAYGAVFSADKAKKLRAMFDAVATLFSDYFLGEMPRCQWDSLNINVRLWATVEFLEQSLRNVDEERARPFSEHGMFVARGAEKGFIIQEIPNRKVPYMDADKKACCSDFKGTVDLVSNRSILACQIRGSRDVMAASTVAAWKGVDINIFSFCELLLAEQLSRGEITTKPSSIEIFSMITTFLKDTTDRQMEDRKIKVLFTTLLEHLGTHAATDSRGTDKPVAALQTHIHAAVALAASPGAMVVGLASFFAAALELLLAGTENQDEKVLNKKYLCAGELLRKEFRRHLKTESVRTALAAMRHSKQNPVAASVDAAHARQQGRNARGAAASPATLDDALLNRPVVHHAVESNVEKLMVQARFPIHGNMRHGVVRDLSRMSTIDTLSHLRRITIPRDDNVSTPDMRVLGSCHIGLICCVKTPDDTDVGITKHLATCAVITPTPSMPMGVMTAAEIHTILLATDVFSGYTHSGSAGGWKQYEGTVPVYINDVFYGFSPANKRMRLAILLRSMRTVDKRMRFVSVTHTRHCVSIRCDAGRLCRPLLIRAQQERYRPDSLQALLDEGIVEYIDMYEARFCMLGAVGHLDDEVQYTHIELDALFVLGVEASLIPFASTNHVSRDMFQANMSCQAMQFNPARLYSLGQKTSKTLLHGQRPVCSTRTYDTLMRVTPNGMNVVMAVLTGGEGCNQEDSLVINQRSVDMGLFTCIRVENIDIKCFPDYVVRTDISVGELGIEQGLLRAGARIDQSTVIAFLKSDTESCIALRANVKPGIVRSIQYLGCSDGRRVLRVRVDAVMKPITGDKYSSRCAQKGVTSTIVPNHMMPYVEDDGTTPDFIINPHAFPSRMTLSHIIEMLLGSLYVLGEIDKPDCTPFEPVPHHHADRLGLGEGRVMVDPGTMMPMAAKVNVGVCYMQALKHHAVEKSSASGYVTRDPITGQPVSGIRTEGALHIGVMELAALLGHGAVHTIKELYIDNSDGTDLGLCTACNNVSMAPIGEHCGKCGADLQFWETPRASVALYTNIQYNEALGLKTTLNYGPRLDVW